MFSFVRRFVFTILLAQWMYAEALVLAPESQPVLDTITQFLRPPTHDKWIETYQYFQDRREQITASVESAGDLKDDLKESVNRFAQQERFHTLR